MAATSRITAAPVRGSLNNGLTTTVGATSTTIFNANTRRNCLILQNLSSQIIYINFGAAASATANSIALQPNQIFTMGLDGGFVTTQSVTAIAGTATSANALIAKQSGA